MTKSQQRVTFVLVTFSYVGDLVTQHIDRHILDPFILDLRQELVFTL